MPGISQYPPFRMGCHVPGRYPLAAANMLQVFLQRVIQETGDQAQAFASDKRAASRFTSPKSRAKRTLFTSSGKFHYLVKYTLSLTLFDVLGKKKFWNEASPHQGDLRLSGPPSGQGAGGGARTRDRKVPADHRADSLAS
ncbi:hypothetical protein PoB_004387900 [Plakobranchus ocellatus]|uniref:Uncharacterized protein n=1 Tax=Plakobranchus ocellatus TaxID=259542 RepID=A0AAV4BB58_9GAST|nr:hypothetical protein PoB_004387900 [Plakobranchus ocellatus]